MEPPVTPSCAAETKEMSHDSPFRALPTELKSAVFAFVRGKRDQGIARLICHEWNDLVIPFMWYTFKIRVTAFTGNLLNSTPFRDDRHFVHVRQLSIQAADGYMNPIGYNMKPLLSKLQKDSLTHFYVSQSIKSSDFLALLTHQSKLRLLTVSINFSDLPSGFSSQHWITEHASVVNQGLHNVEVLLFGFTTPDPVKYLVECQLARSLVENSPKLKHLSLKPAVRSSRPGPKYLSDILGNNRLSAQAVARITALELSRVEFPLHWNSREDYSFFGNLRELRILQCGRPASLLNHVAANFRQTTPKLLRLEVDLRGEMSWEEPLQALDSFLRSFSGLQKLWVHCGWSTKLCSNQSIIWHHKTLQSLALNNPDSSTSLYMTVQDLKEILSSCQQLQHLALNTPGAQLSDHDSRLLAKDKKRLSLEASDPISNDSLRAFLNCVAEAPSLRILRVLSFTRGNSEDAMDRKHRLVKSYADSVVRYLIGHGSNIKWLALSPCENYLERLPVDEDPDGQRFPHYYFARGTQSDIMGRSKIVAVPVPNLRDELPDVEILQPF